jgi:hypothetical protein
MRTDGTGFRSAFVGTRVDVCVLIESEEAEQVSDLIKTFRLADEGFHNV